MDTLFEEFEFKTDHIGYPTHMHTGYQLIYLKKGGLHLRIAAKALTTAAPCFILFNNTEPHSIAVTPDDNERYVANINAKTAAKLVKNHSLLSVFSSTGAGERIIEAGLRRTEFETLLAMLYGDYKSPHIYSNESLAYTFNLLLIKLYTHAPQRFDSHDSKIQAAIYDVKQLLEHDPQKDYALKALSERYNYSESYLLHCFKDATGYSIKQYHMMCRIALASELLAKGDKNITEICFASGFSDCSNFSRYFKSKTGYTPADYKKKYTT